jgi:hypothetical protein
MMKIMTMTFMILIVKTIFPLLRTRDDLWMLSEEHWSID